MDKQEANQNNFFFCSKQSGPVPCTELYDAIFSQVSATDADTGANGDLLYAFSAMQPLENLQFFYIDAVTGSIYLTRSIESRTGQRIELMVEARDKGHPPKVTKAMVEVCSKLNKSYESDTDLNLNKITFFDDESTGFTKYLDVIHNLRTSGCS